VFAAPPAVTTDTASGLALPAIPPPPDLPAVPGYELRGVLGRGGMGVVYKARHVRLNRLVALKMILAGAHASPQQLARFQVEAEAVAGLQHPNVVQLYEVGEHDGCPYLAMEFVEGGSLHERLVKNPPPAAEIAEIVAALADAVRCAHAHGVVHRDLKPANILLTGAGVPKVTDFGLAKRFEDGDSPTVTGAIVGTPQYMAPEQTLGQTGAVGPAADVYALGAILYQCLSGRPPFQGKSHMEVLEKVRTEEPVPPSRLRPRTRRDLETICLKCLRKDPAQRYPGAGELAEDLRRFLRHEPIRARPVGRLERLGKWARRRPALAALLLVLVLAGAGSLIGVWRYNTALREERDRAEKSFRMALDAVNQMLTEVAEKELAEEPRTEEKRRRLLARALDFYKEFLADRKDDPAMRRETGVAYRRLADAFRLLGRSAEAEEAYGQAISLLRELCRDHPGDPDFRQALAEAHNWRGELLRTTGRPREAGEDYHEASRLQEELAAAHPDVPDYRRDLARTHYNLGILRTDAGSLDAALEAFQEAIDGLRPLADKFPDRREFRQHLARGHLNLGNVLQARKDFPEAKKAFEEAIRLLGQLRDEDPYKPDYRHELGVSRNNLGNLFGEWKKLPEAEKCHREAIALFGKLVVDLPGYPVYQRELANSHNSLGAVLARSRNLPAAREEWDTAAGLLRKLIERHATDAGCRADLGRTLANLGRLCLMQNDVVEACRRLGEGADHLEAAVKADPDNSVDRDALRACHRDLAKTLVRRGDHAEAQRRATALPVSLPEGNRGYYLAVCFLGRCVAAVQATTLPQPERDALLRRYADQAGALLAEAGRRGRQGLEPLEDDPDFAPLKQWLGRPAPR
jgi:serine/threonine-protein kinase